MTMVTGCSQLEVLLWVMGHEREEVQNIAVNIWKNARTDRDQHPSDYL